VSTVAAVRERMIEGGARTAQTFGLNRLLGQIYMLLFMHGRPRCLDDIAEELSVSKASVSIACRQLAGLGILGRVWKKGDRKDYYQAETDLRKILDSRLLDSVNRSIESARDQIGEGMAALQSVDGEDGEEADILQARLAEAQAYCDRIAGLLTNPLVRKIL